jgi:hypothetical protein
MARQALTRPSIDDIDDVYSVDTRNTEDLDSDYVEGKLFR